VVEQLREMQQRAGELAAMDGRLPPDEHFFAERNAVLVRNAERYYRTMYRGREDAWNLRDTHMADTLESLVGHLGDGARVVVWEHNSHIGDARATEMARRGELNVGQLVRERYGDASFLVGFTTHSGTVTAARDWGQAARRYNVRPSLENSWERLFHESRRGDFLLRLRDPRVRSALPDSLLERAIGVIYRPETERLSHYFHARIAGQFDAVIHLDHTRAVEPLEPTAAWDGGEVLETYPTGI
ncbi:MAG TPA: erythromycin esterase family protein, partial [Longimicrobiales bacterium]|nr:erythromycin esterase family protein [Longimicrobiales bacterium]